MEENLIKHWSDFPQRAQRTIGNKSLNYSSTNITHKESKHSLYYSIKNNKMCQPTQLDILVVGHDEDNVGPDVPAVSLDATPQSLSSGGDEGQAAWSQFQRQQEKPSHNQHGVWDEMSGWKMRRGGRGPARLCTHSPASLAAVQQEKQKKTRVNGIMLSLKHQFEQFFMYCIRVSSALTYLLGGK